MEGVAVRKRGEFLELDEKTLDRLPYNDDLIKRVITKIKQNNQYLQEDTLGVLFEKLIREEEKKDLGQFYTPQEIVDYMIDYLKIPQDAKILDPTCGCGVFLVSLFNHLKTNKNILQNIYGVDLNETAAKITRINLWLRAGKTQRILNILQKNIRIGNSIVQNKAIDKKAFLWNDTFHDVLTTTGFDFIIGNPPYITLKNKKDYDVSESIFSYIANGTTNAASLVIAKSFELLKDNGIMAFVLPKTLLRVNSYSKLREYILNNSKILHIFDLGSSFKGVKGEQIILVLQKTSNSSSIKKHKVMIKINQQKNKSLKSQKEFYIPQTLFKKHGLFLIFEDKQYYSLIEKINKSGEPLKDKSYIFRGISISPTSSLLSKKSNSQHRPIIKGKDISKSHYTNGLFIKKTAIITSKNDLFNTSKIILQNIFSCEAGIISAVDTNKNITFDTVTNIVLKNKDIDINYLQGLFNSKLFNFYLMYAIYNKSRLTMHTDSVYIGKLPIKKTNQNKQLQVAKIASKLARSKNKKTLLAKLDTLIYNIYQINTRERELIHKALQTMMSHKSLSENGWTNE